MIKMLQYMTLALLSLFYVVNVWVTDSWALEQSKYIRLGSQYGWEHVHLDGCEFEPSRKGHLQVRLSQAEYVMHPSIDLLLHFNGQNNKPWNPPIGNYKILKKNVLFNQKNKIFGSGSGEWKYLDNILILQPQDNSIFRKHQSLGNFSIEFWIYPYSMMDEQYVIQATAPVIKHRQYQFDQKLIVKIEDRRLNWIFQNIFLPVLEKKSRLNMRNVVIKSPLLTANQWSHHSISFDASKNILSYYMNNKRQASQKIVTPNLSQDILIPRFLEDSSSIVTIGQNYLGLIDEFSISFLAKHQLHHHLWSPISGRHITNSHFRNQSYLPQGKVVSKVYDLKSETAYLKKIKASLKLAKNTQINFQYRIDNYPFLLSAKSEDALVWKKLHLNKDLSNEAKLIQGRYFQWRALLEIGEGRKSPLINNLEFEFIINQHPSSPKQLIIFEEDGKVALKWKSPLDQNIKGYRIYYGTKSGNYLLAKVPIFLPINTLAYPLAPTYILDRNLKKNKRYFFSITAVSVDGKESDFSNEVSLFLSASQTR